MLTEMRGSSWDPRCEAGRESNGEASPHWFLAGMPGFLILGLCIALSASTGRRPDSGATEMMAKLIAVVGVREAFGQGVM